MHLSNEIFLERLAELFDARKSAGSVFLTTKRLTYEEPSAAVDSTGDATMYDGSSGERGPPPPPPTASTSTSANDPDREYPLLVRATDGKGRKAVKVKLSTIVQPEEYSTFTDRYTSIMRSHLTSGLRPKRKRTTTHSTKKPIQTSSSSSSTLPTTTTTTTTTGGSGTGTGTGTGGTGIKFSRNLPKVVGPKRGNGRKKRQARQKRRQAVVDKVKRAREERARRSGQTV